MCFFRSSGICVRKLQWRFRKISNISNIGDRFFYFHYIFVFLEFLQFDMKWVALAMCQIIIYIQFVTLLLLVRARFFPILIQLNEPQVYGQIHLTNHFSNWKLISILGRGWNCNFGYLSLSLSIPQFYYSINKYVTIFIGNFSPKKYLCVTYPSLSAN